MNFPTDLRYTSEHEWLRYDESAQTALIGVTDFAQQELGDIVFVDIQPAGSSFARGEMFGTVEAVKTVSELYMPVSGNIVEINAALDGSPELVNKDPYGEGWMVKVELTDPAELDDLLSPETYRDLVGA